MGQWCCGNFESDDGESWLQELCQPILGQVREAMNDDALVHEDIGVGLIPARLQVLASIWEEANRSNRGMMDTPIFPFSLPSTRELLRWRKAYLLAWGSAAANWWTSASAVAARRAVIEETFDRLLGITSAVEQERKKRRSTSRHPRSEGIQG